MKIENLNVSELVPYENNPRRNDSAVDSVAESIKQFGFQQPIVIDSNNVIIAGHTRLKAAKKLGLSSVPCVRAEELTPEQVKAYRILDNKTNELAGWDFNALAEELNSFEFNFEPFAVNLPKFVVDDVFESSSAPYGMQSEGTANAATGYYDGGVEEGNEDIEGGEEQPHQPRHVTAYDPSRKMSAPICWLGRKGGKQRIFYLFSNKRLTDFAIASRSAALALFSAQKSRKITKFITTTIRILPTCLGNYADRKLRNISAR